MSRFPGHQRHKGKKRNRKNAEKRASFDDTTSPFQRNPELQPAKTPKRDGTGQDAAQAARSDARGSAAGNTAGPGVLNGSTGQRNASSETTASGNAKRPGGSHGRTRHKNGKRPAQAQRAGDLRRDGRSPGDEDARRQAEGQNAGSSAAQSHSRFRGKQNRRRRGGEPEIRGLRGPVERAPDVVYEPREPREPRRTKDADNQQAPDETRQPAHAYGFASTAPPRDEGKRGERPDRQGKRHANGTGNDRSKAQPGERGSRKHGEAGRHERPSRGQRPLYAALDLGTNNCRLLIAIPQQKGRFRVIDGFSRIVRLGEGMAQSGELSQAAMDRALEALKICAGKMISHDISRHRLIATEACRQAGNGEAFLERVHAHTGMKLEIIDRRTEAYLAAEGCGSLIDRKAEAAVLFDIGGGSSELALVRRGRKNAPISEQITDWTSLPIGVVTLAERFGGKEVDHGVFERMVEEVRNHLAEFSNNESFNRVWRKGRAHLLGTSGTVTTLAGIHLNLPRYERRLVDGLWMQSGDVDTVLQQLIAMDYDQRASSPCIGQERADLVMAGCAILEAIRRTWPCQTLRVADRGLREGALTQLMSADNAWLPPKRGRWPRKKQR